MRPRWLQHPWLTLLRIDNWTKSIAIAPGVVLAAFAFPRPEFAELLYRATLGIASLLLLSSGNYVLNAVSDADHDARHPVKCSRPMARGLITARDAYTIWIGLLLAGMGAAVGVSTPFFLVMLAFSASGIVYNARGIRTKDIPIVDVLSEAINNPLRLLAGWYLIAPAGIAPYSLLVSYWLLGAYLMALKRYAELSVFTDLDCAAAYRGVFRFYSQKRLLALALVAATFSILSWIVFAVRYRLELMLTLPFLTYVLHAYYRLSRMPDSLLQSPEHTYRDPRVVIGAVACLVSMLVALSVELPCLHLWQQ